ncbi:MAG: hypothetical protein BWY35_00659 [Firmicutes bacterium ADurb.Bin248]|jgi:hypothetical protein|nr:MAG: hypothetical protein BWY35_00659 [Firmicutes bacterium ADurb.Bin248]HPK15020.1 hypothetical protein [Clostridia bacterium]
MKRLSISFLSLLAAALLAGCAALDVVASYGRASLGELLAAHPALLVRDETDPYMRLSADGETYLLVSRDFGASGDEDILIQTPLQPFLDAGLDESKLPEGYRADGALFFVCADYGVGTGARADFADALFEAPAYDPGLLTYHGALDHFGVALSHGKFEWAKDEAKNDKDIVFVLDAARLRGLGADAANVAGWTLVTMQDEKGGDFDVLIKAYDLAP